MAKVRPRRGCFIRALLVFAGVLAVYIVLAYILLPAVLKHYEHNPALEGAPKTTRKSWGKPGDPLNVALGGDEPEIIGSMVKAGWIPAEPKTFGAGLRIGLRELLNRPYPDAPVSNLFLWGRKQDLAFEQPIGRSPRQRHHVRFWRSDELGRDKRPLWIGAATFDRSLGLSRINGEVTHHIAPDVDAERDKLMADLERAGQLVTVYQVTGVGPIFRATNGEGDWYYTDGEMSIGILTADTATRAQPPSTLGNPPGVRTKNSIWKSIRKIIRIFARKR